MYILPYNTPFTMDDRIKVDPVMCSCRRKRVNCPNYRAYGYDCQGKHVKPNGDILDAPFGFGPKKFRVGPNFGDTYMRDHPDEFKRKK